MNDPKILCVCTSHRGLVLETRQCVDALACADIPTIMNIGCADIALARNMDITRGLERANEEGIDVLVLIDDDMVFNVEQVKQIAEHAYGADHPVSGIYIMKNRDLVVWRIPDTKLFVGGMGFMAVSVKLLNERVKTLKKFTWKDSWAYEFCVAGPVDGVWRQEDKCFCEVFGGVELAPIIVAHMKVMPMMPDRPSMERILRELFDEGVT